jgi:hypothetical protein
MDFWVGFVPDRAFSKKLLQNLDVRYNFCLLLWETPTNNLCQIKPKYNTASSIDA